MRFVLPALLSLIPLLTAPAAWADAAGEDAACINETSRQLGVASYGINVLNHSVTAEGAIVTLELAGQVVTCSVSSNYVVQQVSSVDSRTSTTTAAEGWQQGCTDFAAALLGILPSDIAIGDNVGGVADMMTMTGETMVCRIAPDGTVQGVDFH